MIAIFEKFDRYHLQARIFPALLVIAPLILTALAWFPNLLVTNVGGLLVSVAAACGLLVLLGELSRSAGKSLEKRLLTRWGGWPTTLVLRHGDFRLPAPAKTKYHAYLAAHAGVGAFPTVEEESADPNAADAVYGASVLWLKAKSRDSALLLSDNIAYGFRRNLLGLKALGLTSGLLALILPLLALFLMRYPFEQPFSIQSVVSTLTWLEATHSGALAFAVIMLLIWLALIRPAWVRQAADQYTDRLLESCEI